MSEVRVELLLGRKVVAPNGRSAGHIEEILAKEEGDRCVIAEFHLGRYALVERLGAWRIMRAISRHVGHGKSYRVPWDQLDLADPKHPRLLCSAEELKPLDEQ
jgi:hypothetical protein